MKPSESCCLNFGCENPQICDAHGMPCGWPGTADEWRRNQQRADEIRRSVDEQMTRLKAATQGRKRFVGP